MTKLTLELPESAAKKLAALTPEQLAELSALLGYEVKSATISPSEYTRRKRVNDALHVLTTKNAAYLVAVPWNQINRILSMHDFNPVMEGGALSACIDGRLSTCINTGNEGRVHTQVGPNTRLLVSWYRMSSGRYEVISYVS